MLHGRRQLVLLRCLVNSVNERNPLFNLLSFLLKRKSTIKILLFSNRGRRGPRQIVMAFMVWATHVLQWSLQCFD